MSKNKVFIGGLNYNTTEDSLRSLLEKVGTVLILRIVTFHDTGKSRGFGFATFKTDEEAKKAVEELDNTMFEDMRIGVKPAVDKHR
jgi:RNA recognition motif-containing protein